ncbi:MAG: hypothetical protein L3J54_11510 [Draconibacterium sp.]|nr:hypothetical protein [Draconibacterium sp.]
MRILIIILLSFSPFFVFSQKDTVIFFGVNGKVNYVEKADIRKEISSGLFKKTKIITSKANEDNWQFLFTEKIKIVNDSTFKIKIRGDAFSGRVKRQFEMQENGIYKFTDWFDERIKRVGFSKTKIPLILEGEVTDFYSSGRIKSVSQYKNNELITNKNWLPNGKPDVDNIFYSVSSRPLFEPGIGDLHKHILKTFSDSGVDVADIAGKLVIGFVVRTDGTIDGIRIIKGITGNVNAIASLAFQTLPGIWEPAKLNNRDVNYFQLFPINFITPEYNFDYLQMKGSMLYWVIN